MRTQNLDVHETDNELGPIAKTSMLGNCLAFQISGSHAG